MGFDFGTTKIGVAIGQKLTGTATAIAIVKAKAGKPDWPLVDKLVQEWQPSKMIVGLPLNMDDSMSDMAVMATKFSRRLHGRYHLEVELYDERLSSFEAGLEARARGESGNIDDIAAKLILETWLRS